MDERKIFGNQGEALVAQHLQSRGLQVLHRQYKNKYGEIDLICQDGNEIVFVEVKSRHTREYGYPEEAVTSSKIGHILHTAQEYLLETHAKDVPWRIDVVAVEYYEHPPKITHIINIDIPERYW